MTSLSQAAAAELVGGPSDGMPVTVTLTEGLPPATIVRESRGYQLLPLLTADGRYRYILTCFTKRETRTFTA